MANWPSRAYSLEIGSIQKVKEVLKYMYKDTTISLERKAVMAYPYL